MSKDLRRLLSLFTDVVVKNGDFTTAGVEKAFNEFVENITIHKPKPAAASKAPAGSNNAGYVKTTLQEAVEQAKLPIHIPVFKNRFGYWESTLYKGLLFNDEDPQHAIAFGNQGDDGKIHPLTMNQLFVCQANGYRYLKKNTQGSATMCNNELAVN